MAHYKESLQKTSKSFKTPYQISCAVLQNLEDNYQTLAVGLIDGAIILIDLNLGLERQFLEKHPSEITTLAFWEDRVLISGSVDGRVNLNDLEEES